MRGGLKQRCGVVIAAAVLGVSALSAPPAMAGTPAAPIDATTAIVNYVTPPPAKWEPFWRAIVQNDPRVSEVDAFSPSMQRTVPLVVMSPKDNSKPRPIVYLLNGGDGGEGFANWLAQTDVLNFYRDKNVWLVVPMAGIFSYYTDWVHPAPSLGGKQMWETFLTHELPGPLQKLLGASNQRGIIGVSMSATTTLLYAEHHPGFYDAIGSFSGCAETSRGLPLEYLRITLNRGGATPEQMWGPIDGPRFLYNDALLNSERLRGQKMYISSGTGLAGPHDLWNSQFTGGDSGAVWVHVVNGGIIEAAVNHCTHDLKAKLDKEGIPADWNFRPVGTHSWGYWQDDLRKSWPTFARAFGLEDEIPSKPAAATPKAPQIDPAVIDSLVEGWIHEKDPMAHNPAVTVPIPADAQRNDAPINAPLPPAAPAPHAPVAPAAPVPPQPAPAPAPVAPAPAAPAPVPPAPPAAPAPVAPAAPPAAAPLPAPRPIPQADPAPQIPGLPPAPEDHAAVPPIPAGPRTPAIPAADNAGHIAVPAIR